MRLATEQRTLSDTQRRIDAIHEQVNNGEVKVSWTTLKRSHQSYNNVHVNVQL